MRKIVLSDNKIVYTQMQAYDSCSLNWMRERESSFSSAFDVVISLVD